MSFQLTDGIIKSLCGRFSYEKGEAYNRERQVTFLHEDHETPRYEATVKGYNDTSLVTVEEDTTGHVIGHCTCPAYDPDDTYCEHIAAVLLNIHAIQHVTRVPGTTTLTGNLDGDRRLTNHILDLFGNKPQRPSRSQPLFDTREVLELEFTCRPFPYGYGKSMFGIEMKVGPKRLYIVQRIREFLEHIERKEAYIFSKHFTYDPKLHSFQKEDDVIIRQLIEIYHYEQMYQETSTTQFTHAKQLSGDRMLLAPPFSWITFLPALTEAKSVKFEHNDRTFDGIRVSDEPVPLHFEFDQTQAEGFQLDVQGLDKITVMESYGVVLSEGKLMHMQAEPCKRLSELKQMLENSSKHQIQIPSAQMEPFMEKVIPGLMKLGSVHISGAISDRIMQTPLKAKLYLDRVKDRLLAGLEFQYGDIVINPLEGNEQRRGTDRILMRDGDQERRILDLMEQSAFAKMEEGYFMDGEDEEYEFLYHVVPQLEKLVSVYATSAVKIRLLTGHAPPIVKVDVDERTDWLEFKFSMEGISETEIRKLLKSLGEKRKYHRLPDGALLPLESAEFQEIVRVMNEMGITKEDVKAAEIRLPLVRGLYLLDSERQGNTVKLGRTFRQLLENMRNPDNLDFTVPTSLEPVLRDYQKYGFQWLKTLAQYNFGGILADDMGLGKTIQSIAFIVSVLPEIRKQALPALIVAPASLVYNWLNELKKFAPEIRAVIADGSREERSKILKHASQVDVLITSYPLLRRDIDLYAKQSYHTLILDEAQVFKNHSTQTAQAVKEIQAEYRFALTGTPVENRLEELWSIFDAVFPQLFPGRKAFNELSRESVAKRIRPFLLRRLKTDVLKELPEKIESLQASELLPEQKKLYAAYLAELQQETLKHLNKDSFNKHRIKILAGLTRLRQLCCHPSLFVEDYAGSSAKFEQLMEIIEECRSAGKRVLIFSQFTAMLGMIGRDLGYQGVPFFYLDGKTPTAERVELCSKFNEGERDLFLISLKAGGTGLNLASADTVILYDLWWNPAVEQQAADRAHRIGQKKVVQVIRLVAQGTVEDKMYELQQKKKNLIDEVIQPGQEALSALTEQEIREILMIG
ncbi:SNF2 helicase associated domain-containing protein [Paenibacillus frigoriresistens]|uniref:DEAD/DEAH box helicase n=1 Tax=Paenibacillus alginolyticus TaxID=59839 RepID=UPI0015648F3D|nr:DEAD/DEAH box helicase [Paenibacillus frigoriresistens]NRF91737.1 SNF2 helicase associated domain-containing protein [Paenibacillus frigoriresistens]